MALPPMSKRDSEQVLRYAFDDNTGRLRVDANVVVAPGGISAADGDNIAISDGVDTVVVNPDGSLNTVSSITGQVDVELSAADGDNIAISDGVDTLAVNPDGSINVNVAAGSIVVEIDAADGDNIAIADATTGDLLTVNPDGSVNITDNGASLTVDGTVNIGNFPAVQPISDNGSSLTVDAINFDIRDLLHTQDSIKVGNGTDFLAVNANGSINTNTDPVGLKTGLTTSRLTITSTAQQVPTSDLANRNVISIRVLGSNVIYFGNSTVTIATGYPKYQYEEIVMDVQDLPVVDVWAVCAPGETCVIAIMEIA